MSAKIVKFERNTKQILIYFYFRDEAQAKLLRWIKRDPKFHAKLLQLVITPNDNHYNPQQIRELVLKFGAPGEYGI